MKKYFALLLLWPALALAEIKPADRNPAMDAEESEVVEFDCRCINPRPKAASKSGKVSRRPKVDVCGSWNRMIINDLKDGQEFSATIGDHEFEVSETIEYHRPQPVRGKQRTAFSPKQTTMMSFDARAPVLEVSQRMLNRTSRGGHVYVLTGEAGEAPLKFRCGLY